MSDVAVDSSAVYWLAAGTGTTMGMGSGGPATAIFSCKLGTACGTSPSVVGSVPGAEAIAVSTDAVYAAGPQGGFVCTLSGSCSSLSSGTGAAVSQLAADGTGLYAATMSGPVFCKAPCTRRSTLVVLDPMGAAALGIAVTAARVYWSDSSGGIFFAPKAGS